MATISEALTTAIREHQAGRLPAAEQVYRQILALEPNHPEALHLLGVLCGQTGNYHLAAEFIRRAVAVKPEWPEALANLGNALREEGRLEEAVGCFRRALRLKPDSAVALNNLGNALKAQGRLDEALACYRRALKLQPDYAKAHFNLGALCKDQGQFDEAVACFRRALNLDPDFAAARSQLGNVLKDQGRLGEAVACYRRAIERKPDFAEAHNDLGSALREQGRLDEAAACLRRALELRPHFPEALNNLGNALKDQRKPDEAIACYRRGLELKPDFAEALQNLGGALKDQGRLDEAIACYRRALELKPDFAEALYNLGSALKDQANLDEAIACFRRALELRPGYAEAHSSLLYTQIFCPGYDAQALYEEHCRWNQRYAAPLAKCIEPHPNARSPGRRLRVGYVSAHFCDHVVGRNLLPLFREHDRRQFEIFCYADLLRDDEITDRFRALADTWRDAGFEPRAACPAHSRRPHRYPRRSCSPHAAQPPAGLGPQAAPVQLTFAGYPGTTGLAAIDYRLTDPYLDPPGLFDRCYSEESVRLPEAFWCYDPLASRPAVNPLPALERGRVTFGCLNNFCKINAPVLRLWARILKAVDRSRLAILAADGAHRQQALNFLQAEGVTPDRVAFFGPQPRPAYLQLYHRIDLGLDTFPYNGHTTSLDAFWMGVPVVTLAGPTVVGRAGLCQLRNLDLPELIGESAEQFVEIAVRLAGDLPRLSLLRATLRERMQASPLMDASRFARNIEAAYRAMWKRWCRDEG